MTAQNLGGDCSRDQGKKGKLLPPSWRWDIGIDVDNHILSRFWPDIPDIQSFQCRQGRQSHLRATACWWKQWNKTPVNMLVLKARIHIDVTRLNWHDIGFDTLTNGQAAMHYSRHRLTASVAYVIMLTWTRANQWPVGKPGEPTGHCHPCPLVSSSKTKPCQFSSVTCRSVRVLMFTERNNMLQTLLPVIRVDVNGLHVRSVYSCQCFG